MLIFGHIGELNDMNGEPAWVAVIMQQLAALQQGQVDIKQQLQPSIISFVDTLITLLNILLYHGCNIFKTAFQ